VRESTLRLLAGGPPRAAAAAGLAVVAVTVLAPLAILGVSVARHPPSPEMLDSGGSLVQSALLTAGLALGLAILAVVLGYLPGKILGTAGRGRTLLFWLVLAALVLPHHVLFYIWRMPLAPTTWLGAQVEQSNSLARALHLVISSSVLVFGFWPLAALLLAQGWRNIEPECLRMARLEAGAWRRLVSIELPMLRRPLLVSLAACFVLIFADHSTFYLARIDALGRVLDVIYQSTYSVEAVAVASWPAIVLAVAVAVPVARHLEVGLVAPPQEEPQGLAGRFSWTVLAALLAVTLVAPVAILLSGVGQVFGMTDYWAIIRDKAAWSVVSAVVAAVLALAMAGGVLAAERQGRAARIAGRIAGVILLVAMFLPGNLLGAAIISAGMYLPASWSNGWWIVSVGQAVRFAGVALIMLRLARDDTDRHLEEMAGADGASWWSAWWQVRWPRAWPLVTGAGIMVVLLSFSEVETTMMVLPPGVPNFTQHLFNQMHYFRDSNIVASCLLVMAIYLALAVPVVMLLAYRMRLEWGRPAILLAAAVLAAAGAAGCDDGGESGTADGASPRVLAVLGATGRGPGELVYPRPLDLDAEGNVVVIDRTGRIQVLSDRGSVVRVIDLPVIEKGYPVGVTVAPGGLMYVADTHYQRVLVYDAQGKLLRSFGEYGTGPGQFIYPTDVAVAPDGRLFVSEYGGNDRVSIYTADGRFLSSFGRLGTGEGEFSRPNSLAIDESRGILYVADACNHRIARYGLDGTLKGYLGSAGTGPGQLRYPYGLALTADGSLVICENGNNRVQILDPEGRSLGCLGSAGRQAGQLAYPWGVAIDGRGWIFVSDSGNNRIQVWQR
jgi:ABC-type Fe3+ transport system permease subunit/sugar lactone lactonase YvrE